MRADLSAIDDLLSQIEGKGVDRLKKKFGPKEPPKDEEKMGEPVGHIVTVTVHGANPKKGQDDEMLDPKKLMELLGGGDDEEEEKEEED